MHKFMIKFRYSSGSWARVLKVADDQAAAVRALVEALGGSLEGIWWEVETGTANAVTNLPDAVSAAAVVTLTTRTGAFAGVEAHELLSQEQLHDAIMLAKSVSEVYDPPGNSAVLSGA